MLADGDTVCASDEPGSAFSDPDGRRNKTLSAIRVSAAVLVIGVNEIRVQVLLLGRVLYFCLFGCLLHVFFFVSFFPPSRWTLRFVLVD